MYYPLKHEFRGMLIIGLAKNTGFRCDQIYSYKKLLQFQGWISVDVLVK